MPSKPAIAIPAAFLVALLVAVAVAVLTGADRRSSETTAGAATPAAQRTPPPTETASGDAAEGRPAATTGVVRPGVYLARITDLNRTPSQSTVEITFGGSAGDLKVTAVAGTGIGATECTNGTPEPSASGLIFMTDEASLKSRYRGAGRFRAGDDDGLTITGRPTADDTVTGTLSLEMPADCTATIDFTAHRQPDGQQSVAERVLIAGS